jgi:cytochrome bd-type quinol oxidase subunit 1
MIMNLVLCSWIKYPLQQKKTHICHTLTKIFKFAFKVLFFILPLTLGPCMCHLLIIAKSMYMRIGKSMYMRICSIFYD